MPIYEYRTESGRTFELFFRRADDAGETATDPATGEVGNRIMSGAGFAFKGSGFYLTDYGKNAHRGGAAPAKGGESGGDGAKSDGGSAGASKSEGAKGDGGASATGDGGAKSGGEAKTPAPSTPAPSAPASAPKKASE